MGAVQGSHALVVWVKIRGIMFVQRHTHLHQCPSLHPSCCGIKNFRTEVWGVKGEGSLRGFRLNGLGHSGLKNVGAQVMAAPALHPQGLLGTGVKLCLVTKHITS